MVQEYIIADLQRKGITLLSAAPGEENLCSADPGRKLVRQMMDAFAEYEKAMIVARLRAARDRKKLTNPSGKCEGAPLYGTLPGEAKIRDRILKMRARKGTTLQSIADALNAEGVKPRRGKIWHAMSVRRVAARKPA
jgi:DNA invertase Pin-like site-specific DNA recombinase